jgi:hypothetical protein
VCCRACARSKQLFSIAFSFALGWWSLWGLFLTPIQIIRNIFGLVWPPDPSQPSPSLQQAASQQYAHSLYAYQQQQAVAYAMASAPPGGAQWSGPGYGQG